MASWKRHGFWYRQSCTESWIHPLLCIWRCTIYFTSLSLSVITHEMGWMSSILSLDDKGLSSQSYGFPSSHVWMWELDYKESWAPKNWCFWTVVLEKTESPLDCKEIQQVHPKGDQSWVFIGRTDVESESPILWPPDVQNWLIGKDLDAGKDWRQKEKGKTEDETVGWHHWLDGHEFEQAPGVCDGQGSLACCSPWCVSKCQTQLSDWTVLWYFCNNWR